MSPDLLHVSLEEVQDYRLILPVTASGYGRTWKTIKEDFRSMLECGAVTAKLGRNGRIRLFVRGKNPEL